MSRSDVVSENSSSNVLYSTTTWILKDLKLILSSEDDAEGFGGQLAQCLLGFRHSDASVYVFSSHLSDCWLVYPDDIMMYVL